MEWISVKERLPEIPIEAPSYMQQIKVLVAWGSNNGNIDSMNFVREKIRGKIVERFKWNGKLSPWDVTHWMPLPEPPKK